MPCCCSLVTSASAAAGGIGVLLRSLAGSCHISRRCRIRGAHCCNLAVTCASVPLRKLGGNCSLLAWQLAHQVCKLLTKRFGVECVLLPMLTAGGSVAAWLQHAGDQCIPACRSSLRLSAAITASRRNGRDDNASSVASNCKASIACINTCASSVTVNVSCA